VGTGGKPLILALDQGTTSSRSILFDAHGAVVAMAQREFAQHYPEPGRVEHDAREIWAAQQTTIREVLAAAHARPGDLTAIGLTNQRETCLLWERSSGEPVGPAIVWQDRRSAAMCERLRAEGHESEVARCTGLLLDPYFSATKLAWLFEHIPGARERARRGELAFGTIDSWLIWQLTGGAAHVTDLSNASRTLLLDLHSADWSQPMLDLFDIPRACLPQLIPSSQRRGEAPQALLDGNRIPITGVAGDQQAALFGQACFRPGSAKNTYGTGCFVLMNTGPAPATSHHRLLATIGWQRAGAARIYALEGSVFSGGAVVQWLRDALGVIESAAEVEALAASVPDSAGVHFVPAFAGLGAPHWQPDARAAILGLTRGATRAHVARAALEAIAFQSCEVLQAMQRDAGAPLIELRVDGGASANDLLMQFQADLLGVPLLRPAVTESTALGAAWLAGLGAGVWSTEEELAAQWRIGRRFEPARGRDWARERLEGWERALRRVR
jgi:glycerol kinase